MINITKLQQLKYLLIATSSLASTCFAVPATNLQAQALATNPLHWSTGQGLQAGDDVILGMNLTGLTYNIDHAGGVFNVNGKANSGLVIREGRAVSYTNIINDQNNEKISVEFDVGVGPSTFTVRGDDISGLGDISIGNVDNVGNFCGRNSTVIFNPVGRPSYDRLIYGDGIHGGIRVENDLTFNNKIGYDQFDNLQGVGFISIIDNKTLTIKADVNSFEVMLEGANARLIIDTALDNINVQSTVNNQIYLGNDQRGIIEMRGPNNMHMALVLGDEDNRIRAINIIGNSNVTFDREVYAKEITIDRNTVIFRSDVDMFTRQLVAGFARAQQNITDRGTLEFADDGVIELAAGKYIYGDIRARNNNSGTLKYAGDRQLDTQIGTAGAKLKSIQFSTPNANIQLSTNDVHAGELRLLDAGQMLAIDDNIGFNGKIAGRGTVQFTGRSTVEQIGELNARALRVQAGVGGVDFNLPVHADIIDINGAAPVRFLDRMLDTNHILLSHRNAKVMIVNGLANPVTIRAAAAGYGEVTFAADGNIGVVGQVGLPVGTVEFQNNSRHTLHGDIYTNTIIFDNGVITPQNNNIRIVVPQAAIVNPVPAGWQYVLNALVIANAPPQPAPVVLPIQPPLPVPQPQPAPVAVELQPVPQQQAVQQQAQPNIAQIKQLLLQPAATITSTPPTEQAARQDIINKTLITQTAAPVIQDYRNIDEAIDQWDNAGVQFSKEEVAVAREDTIITEKPKEQQALLYAVSMAPLSHEERKKTVDRMEAAVQAQIKVAEQVTETIHHTIDHRMNELSFNQSQYMTFTGDGIAAGGEDKRKLQGVWVRGNYGTSQQGVNNATAGYGSTVTGGTIGTDFELNDQNTVGIAYSNMRSAFKYKQSRSGDKTSGDSHILSLYGAHQLNNNLLLKTMLSAGMSKITTKRLVIDKIANGKLKNKSYSGEGSLNYNIKAAGNIYFVPHVGLRYANYRDGAYSEHGTGVHNVSVAARSNDTLAAIAGVNMMIPHRLSETLVIAPSIHTSVESYLLNKKPKVKAKLAWMDNYFENSANTDSKGAKFSYNIGGGISAQRNNIEVSANYNCNLRKKYQSHQGAVRLKILF